MNTSPKTSDLTLDDQSPYGIEITYLVKDGDTLTKRISLSDGKLNSDGSVCVMSDGTAYRYQIPNMAELVFLLTRLESNEAIALGALREGLPDQVTIVTKSRVDDSRPDVIARTVESFVYRKDRPALSLLDYDQKGMTDEVAARLREVGGFKNAILQLVPQLIGIAYLLRASTSAGIYHKDTGDEFLGSGGEHLYLAVMDGADINRFLRVLHDRCWLAGFGWYILGAAGQLLERSIVDRMVGSPERLVFEGPPKLGYPLAQNKEKRIPEAVEGEFLDTFAVMPPLTKDEENRLREMRRREEERLAPEAAKVREQFIQRHAERLIAGGMSREDAERIIRRQCEHVLLGPIELVFDDPRLAGNTVGDVLDNPKRFEGETLADPIEGVEYGRGKAKVLLRHNNGKPFIRSFAHGGASYELRWDEAAEGVTLDDFWAYMPMHKYMFSPTRELWPQASINSRIPPIPLFDAQGNPVLDSRGEQIKVPANVWLDKNQPVEQMTWAPGLPMVIRDKLILEGGWVDRRDVACFNLYLPPTIELGDASKAAPWVELIEYIYPDDAEHILNWCAQRVQNPEIKTNHALVLIGEPGIGKDTILAALRHAVGPWNCQEVTPPEIFGSFNSFLRSVILKINEAHDLGDFDRYQLYDRLKVYAAAPPDVLRVNEKYLRQYMLVNCCGVVITSNHKTDGIYLPADDRRHYVAASDKTMQDQKFRGDYERIV